MGASLSCVWFGESVLVCASVYVRVCASVYVRVCASVYVRARARTKYFLKRIQSCLEK